MLGFTSPLLSGEVFILIALNKALVMYSGYFLHISHIFRTFALWI